MSLSVPYENIHDAQMRLQNSVVLYDGEPVYITDVSEKGPGDPKADIFRVHATPLPYKGRGNEEGMRKFISSKRFDMAPFPMGFMNLAGIVYYCSRLPRRQQRQGLCNGTFACVPVGNPHQPALRLENVLGKREFYDCIKGTYPSFDEARRMLDKGAVTAVSFARSFALIQDTELPELIYLYHKKDKVGFLKGDELQLSKNGRCLVEALREGGVRC